MQVLQQKVKKLAKELKPTTIAWRRHIHAHPELSFEEHQTVAFVEKTLSEMGIDQYERKATTGLVVKIKGKNPEKREIALRADMDALPIHEQNEVPYCSKVEGVMHACGHDVHTASLLGAANILHQTKSDWEGTVRLIFQPGEERIPGGASLMIKDQALEHPRPTSIIGQHVMPFIPVGKVGFRSGLYMASADEIYLKVKGKGGHAATPHLNIDPVMITVQVLSALQQVISRKNNPKIPSVLSFGSIETPGASTNVIPNEVLLAGTFRTLDETWRAEAHEQIEKIAKITAQALGGECEVEIRKGYPHLKNHEQLTKRNRQRAEDYLGAENVEELDVWMAAEDFSYYTQMMDGCFYRLGTRNEAKNIISSVHTPTFDIDEDAIEIGAGLMAWLAICEVQDW